MTSEGAAATPIGGGNADVVIDQIILGWGITLSANHA